MQSFEKNTNHSESLGQLEKYQSILEKTVITELINNKKNVSSLKKDMYIAILIQLSETYIFLADYKNPIKNLDKSFSMLELAQKLANKRYCKSNINNFRAIEEKLGVTNVKLFYYKKDIRLVRDSIQNFKNQIELILHMENYDPYVLSSARLNLATAYTTLAKEDNIGMDEQNTYENDRITLCNLALDQYRLCFDFNGISQSSYPKQYFIIKTEIAGVCLTLFNSTKDISLLEESISCSNEAIRFIDQDSQPADFSYCLMKRAGYYCEMYRRFPDRKDYIDLCNADLHLCMQISKKQNLQTRIEETFKAIFDFNDDTLVLYDIGKKFYEESNTFNLSIEGAFSKTGFHYFEIGDYSKAHLYFNFLIDLSTCNEKALAYIALTFSMEKKYSEALESINRALPINPSNFYLWEIKGDVLTNLGRFDEGKFCLEKSKKLKNDVTDEKCKQEEKYMNKGSSSNNPEAKLIIQVEKMCIRQKNKRIFPSEKEEILRQKVMKSVIDAFEDNDDTLFDGYKKPIYQDLINDTFCTKLYDEIKKLDGSDDIVDEFRRTALRNYMVFRLFDIAKKYV